MFQLPPAWAQAVWGSDEYELLPEFTQVEPLQYIPVPQLVEEEPPLDPLVMGTQLEPFQYWFEEQLDV